MNRRNVIKGAAAAAVIGTVEAVHGVPGDDPYRIGFEIVERKKPELYVEISARQTGKTQRLCAAVKDHCDRDRANVAIIISPHMTHQMIMERYRGIVETWRRNGIKACLPGKDQVQVFTNPNSLKALMAADGWFQDQLRTGRSPYSPDHPSVRWFFDEWDFHEPYGPRSFQIIPFVDNGYYATTLSRMRTVDDLGPLSPPSLFRTLMERASCVVNIRRRTVSKLSVRQSRQIGKSETAYKITMREYSESGQIFHPQFKPTHLDLPMGMAVRLTKEEDAQGIGDTSTPPALIPIPLYHL